MGSAESLRKDGFGQIDRFVCDCLPVIPGQKFISEGICGIHFITTFSIIP